MKNDHLWSFFNIIYTVLVSIFEPCYIQNSVITNRVIKRLECIDIYHMTTLLLSGITSLHKQEAHGPWFAHLSDIATADMQMLCNIFPIPSSQLMKISSFEEFLVFKKNIWACQSMEHDHLNKLSITFQQKDQCEIWWKLAKWFLKNHDFIHVNSTVAGKYYKYKPDDGLLIFPIRTILTTVDLQVTSILSI